MAAKLSKCVTKTFTNRKLFESMRFDSIVTDESEALCAAIASACADQNSCNDITHSQPFCFSNHILILLFGAWICQSKRAKSMTKAKRSKKSKKSGKMRQLFSTQNDRCIPLETNTNEEAIDDDDDDNNNNDNDNDDNDDSSDDNDDVDVDDEYFDDLEYVDNEVNNGIVDDGHDDDDNDKDDKRERKADERVQSTSTRSKVLV